MKSPAAMCSSPRRAVPANQLPAMVPAHSVRTSSRAWAALTDVINQRLQFGPFRSQQGFAVELGGQDLVFGGHAPSHSVHGPRKSEPSARVLPPGQLRRRNEVTDDRKH
jgi:hypothetical protein